jgi:hypothetical protein
MAYLSHLNAEFIMKSLPWHNLRLDQGALSLYLKELLVKMATNKKNKTSASLRKELIELTRATDELRQIDNFPKRAIEAMESAAEAIGEAMKSIQAIEEEKKSK